MSQHSSALQKQPDEQHNLTLFKVTRVHCASWTVLELTILFILCQPARKEPFYHIPPTWLADLSDHSPLPPKLHVKSTTMVDALYFRRHCTLWDLENSGTRTSGSCRTKSVMIWYLCSAIIERYAEIFGWTGSWHAFQKTGPQLGLSRFYLANASFSASPTCLLPEITDTNLYWCC